MVDKQILCNRWLSKVYSKQSFLYPIEISNQ
jgi:hypothetical protein